MIFLVFWDFEVLNIVLILYCEIVKSFEYGYRYLRMDWVLFILLCFVRNL